MTTPNNLPPSQIPPPKHTQGRFGNDIEDHAPDKIDPYLTPNLGPSLSQVEAKLAMGDTHKSRALDMFETMQDMKNGKLSRDGAITVLAERGCFVSSM
jgi:hypothetical protein